MLCLWIKHSLIVFSKLLMAWNNQNFWVVHLKIAILTSKTQIENRHRRHWASQQEIILILSTMKPFQASILIFVTYSLLLESVVCKTRLLIYGWNKATGSCSALDYIPGGVASVQTTTAPTAQLQKSAFQYIFSHTRTGHVKGAGDVTKEVAGKRRFSNFRERESITFW